MVSPAGFGVRPTNSELPSSICLSPSTHMRSLTHSLYQTSGSIGLWNDGSSSLMDISFRFLTSLFLKQQSPPGLHPWSCDNRQTGSVGLFQAALRYTVRSESQVRFKESLHVCKMLTRAFWGPRELWVILELLSLLPGIFHCITHRIWHTC